MRYFKKKTLLPLKKHLNINNRKKSFSRSLIGFSINHTCGCSGPWSWWFFAVPLSEQTSVCCWTYHEQRWHRKPGKLSCLHPGTDNYLTSLSSTRRRTWVPANVLRTVPEFEPWWSSISICLGTDTSKWKKLQPFVTTDCNVRRKKKHCIFIRCHIITI